MTRQSAIVISFGLVTVFCAAAWARGEESLGEVAEQEKERRALVEREQRGPARFITLDDLLRGRPLDFVESYAEEGPGDGSGGGRPRTDEPSGLELYWQDRLQAAREAVEAASRRAADLEGEALAARGPSPETNYDAALADAAVRKQKIDDYQVARRELAEARRALDNLESEARRAGMQVSPPKAAPSAAVPDEASTSNPG